MWSYKIQNWRVKLRDIEQDKLLLFVISIILMLYSPRYPVNITFQGAAVKLSSFFVLFVKF